MSDSKVPWPKHLQLLDVSRTLASFAVVFWHWQHFAYLGTELSPDFERAKQPFYSIFKLGYEAGGYGVEYFFILSGFIFFWLYEDAVKQGAVSVRKYTLQRFSRLYPLHAATLLLVLLLQLAFRQTNDSWFVYEHNDVYHFVLNVLFAARWGLEKGYSYNGPIWSVSVEIVLYALFFILCRSRLTNRILLSAVSVVAFGGFVVTDNYLLRGLSAFLLGAICLDVCRVATKSLPLSRLLLVGAVAAWSLVLWHVYVFDLKEPATEVFGNLAKAGFRIFPAYVLFPLTLCSLVVYEVRRKPNFGWIAWTGNITYSSYLLHFPLQLAFVIAMRNSSNAELFYTRLDVFVLYFALFIPISYGSYVLYEKPAQQWLRKRFSTVG